MKINVIGNKIFLKKRKWLGWTPSKGGYPNRNPAVGGEPLDIGEGDCDTDADCAPGLKCGHDGRNVLNVVDSKGNPLKPNEGHRDYCYDPNIGEFKGNLIEPGQCEKFKQMFPCVGPNMFTGPHTPECLKDLWKKSGCSGDLNSRVTDQKDYNWWNTHSYENAGRNMRNFATVAYKSTNYSEANTHFKKCYGREVDACEERFRPRPIECSRRIYRQAGLQQSGKLQPDKRNTWPSGWVSQWWKNGQEGNWSIRTFFNQLLHYKHQNIRDSINPKANFDRYMYNNQLVRGVYPQIPWEKPCWKDFVRMMTATEYIKLLDNGNLSFAGNTGGGFKAILPQQGSLASRSGIKEGMYWVGNYFNC